jgi:pimeloyl-ACP methyl ester carboxylesterase
MDRPAEDATVPRYESRYWWSPDGLRLHYRDYAGGADGRPPVICLPGLTRNARDFEELAERLSPAWRVLCPDFRGRGESAYAKDPMTYVPLTYVGDVDALLSELGIARFVAVGTSLGGIVTMLLAGAGHGRLAAAVLNDVGPQIEAAGLARIRGYVGRASSWPTWLHAARGLKEANGDVYPDWGIEDWLAHAKRLYRLTSAGRIVLDYDLRIAEPLRVPGNEAGPDMWRALGRLGGVPTLVVRGALSDLLSQATAERMVAELGTAGSWAELVTVPRVGHAPLLTETPVEPALDRLLAQAGEPASP